MRKKPHFYLALSKKVNSLAILQFLHLFFALLICISGYYLLDICQPYDPIIAGINKTLKWAVFLWSVSVIFFAVFSGVSENIEGNFLKFGIHLYRNLLCNKFFLVTTLVIFSTILLRLGDKIYSYRIISIISKSRKVRMYVKEDKKSGRKKFLLELDVNKPYFINIPKGNPEIHFTDMNKDTTILFLEFNDNVDYPENQPYTFDK